MVEFFLGHLYGKFWSCFTICFKFHSNLTYGISISLKFSSYIWLRIFQSFFTQTQTQKDARAYLFWATDFLLWRCSCDHFCLPFARHAWCSCIRNFGRVPACMSMGLTQATCLHEHGDHSFYFCYKRMELIINTYLRCTTAASPFPLSRYKTRT